MQTHNLDVLIIGAGLSGVCAAYYLQTQAPNKTFAILEGRSSLGGTWDLFRYPGIRSDSDMYTLGYSFSPWTSHDAIAEGADILNYLKDTAKKFNIDKKIQFNHRVKDARWSTADQRWHLQVQNTQNDTLTTWTARFLLGCTGYYNYDAGYTPDFPNIDTFQGRLVHPQHWTPDIDATDKRVIVIGSGATAITLVPALAKTAKHVTMLQRSPTYIASVPRQDPLSTWSTENLPPKYAHALLRWKNILYGIYTYQMTQTFPAKARQFLTDQVREALKDTNIDIDTHFNPTYNPWDQRLCLIPDGDLFTAINDGKVDIITDHIDTFTPTGLRLRSGETLEADIIVTATGLQLQLMGGATMHIDDTLIDASKHVMYRGTMLSGIPNMALCVGYTNASWTLKCELACAWVCRLINYMDDHNHTQCHPHNPNTETSTTPLLNLDSGYIHRAKNILPRQGDRPPWKLYQNYLLDKLTLRTAPLNDKFLRFDEPLSPTNTRASS